MTGVTMGNPAAAASSVMAGPYPDSSTDEDDDEGDIFAELKTTRCTSWQYELRQMEKVNRLLAEELTQLMANKKKRKRRKGGGTGFGTGGSGAGAVRDCANCHRRDTPEWRRGPSGNRDLCNSCGLRYAKQVNFLFPLNFHSLLFMVADEQAQERQGLAQEHLARQQRSQRQQQLEASEQQHGEHSISRRRVTSAEGGVGRCRQRCQFRRWKCQRQRQ